jgi:hypothetical protein
MQQLSPSKKVRADTLPVAPRIFDHRISDRVTHYWMSFLDLNSHTRFRETCLYANTIQDPRSFPPLIEITVRMVQGCRVHPGLHRLLQRAITSQWTKWVTIKAGSDICWELQWPHLSLNKPVSIPTLWIHSPKTRNGESVDLGDELEIEEPLGIAPDKLIVFGTVDFDVGVVSSKNLEMTDTIDGRLPRGTLSDVLHLTIRKWSTEGKRDFVGIHDNPIGANSFRARIQDNFRNIETLTIKQTTGHCLKESDFEADEKLAQIISDKLKNLKTIKLETSRITTQLGRALFAMTRRDKNKIDVQMDENTVEIAGLAPSIFLKYETPQRVKDGEFIQRLQEENRALRIRLRESQQQVEAPQAPSFPEDPWLMERLMSHVKQL